jgi:hypothetical protein
MNDRNEIQQDGHLSVVDCSDNNMTNKDKTSMEIRIKLTKRKENSILVF